MIKSLKAREHKLAQIDEQLKVLSGGDFASGELPTFKEKLEGMNEYPLRPVGIEILQVNVGYMCNQVCKHCHVDAGPDRKEIMTRENMEHVLHVLRNANIQTLDLTGGAPGNEP